MVISFKNLIKYKRASERETRLVNIDFEENILRTQASLEASASRLVLYKLSLIPLNHE